ncbi:hypothetical protein [Streptacidiphilus sp. P02-A3a]|nr:hypothetical protein [Streptacidiphilus sp. P02-A3a]QMU67521.1 hypothetical protein GXP74_04065 [Streptacidiphilus sp. P02-A3a]
MSSFSVVQGAAPAGTALPRRYQPAAGPGGGAVNATAAPGGGGVTAA